MKLFVTTIKNLQKISYIIVSKEKRNVFFWAELFRDVCFPVHYFNAKRWRHQNRKLYGESLDLKWKEILQIVTYFSFNFKYCVNLKPCKIFRFTEFLFNIYLEFFVCAFVIEILGRKLYVITWLTFALRKFLKKRK